MPTFSVSERGKPWAQEVHVNVRKTYDVLLSCTQALKKKACDEWLMPVWLMFITHPLFSLPSQQQVMCCVAEYTVACEIFERWISPSHNFIRTGVPGLAGWHLNYTLANLRFRKSVMCSYSIWLYVQISILRHDATPVLMFCLGLGTKNAWLGFVKDHVLSCRSVGTCIAGNCPHSSL